MYSYAYRKSSNSVTVHRETRVDVLIWRSIAKYTHLKVDSTRRGIRHWEISDAVVIRENEKRTVHGRAGGKRYPYVVAVICSIIALPSVGHRAVNGENQTEDCISFHRERYRGSSSRRKGRTISWVLIGHNKFR